MMSTETDISCKLSSIFVLLFIFLSVYFMCACAYLWSMP